jgi:formylglycine-generating enzyme required for sulfatase activity
VDSGLPGLGVSVGSSGFAAPEQQMQGTVSIASDIYSLGATLYALLTGSVPPDALHRESRLTYLDAARDVNPNVEPYLSMVATRAMDLRPDARYESVKVFIQALERPAGWAVSQQEGPRRSEFDQSAPPPRLPQKKRKKMEQRTILALSAVLLIIIGFVGGLVYANTRPEVQEAQAAATATIESQVIAALTAITTVTPSPAPSATPVPTPEPVVDETTGARLIYVPGGIFRMGDNDGESDESPSHIVKLDPYFIDETEVTNGQYAYCVDEGVCNPPSRPGATLHRAYFGDPAFDDYPVIFVNWFDARNYCAWRGARLPSEAEWERAAAYDPVQAIKYRYPWGDEFDGTSVNFCDTNCPQVDKNIEFDDKHNDTAPVATFPDGASPFGVYDMAGNVMEWVSDWYDPRYYRESTDTNPLGPLEGEFKSLRGGSWLSSENEVRTSGRSSYLPSVSRANLGFRCAMTAP